MRLGARLDLERALQRRDRLGRLVRALEDEREIVERKRVAGVELQDAPERADGFSHVLLRLRQPQREMTIRIVGRLSNERASALHRFGALARLDERENQVVDGLAKVRALGHRPAVRVDRGVERPHAVERFPEPVLNVGITRREPGRLPQQRERAREIPARLQLDRPRVRVLRARRRLLRTRGGAGWEKNEGDDRQPHRRFIMVQN